LRKSSNALWNKSLSFDDVLHTFNFSTLYKLPFGKGKPFVNTGGGAGSGGRRMAIVDPDRDFV
jgi:hypothetical protein